MRIGLFDFLNAYPYQRALQQQGLEYTLFLILGSVQLLGRPAAGRLFFCP